MWTEPLNYLTRILGYHLRKQIADRRFGNTVHSHSPIRLRTWLKVHSSLQALHIVNDYIEASKQAAEQETT